jgi:hypothetical protein
MSPGHGFRAEIVAHEGNPQAGWDGGLRPGKVFCSRMKIDACNEMKLALPGAAR